MMRFIFIIVVAQYASAMWSGTTLSLTSCASASPDSLVSARADGTVRSADSSLCATYVGPSPAQIKMLPCSGTNQYWPYNATTYTFEWVMNSTNCVAWNTQGPTNVLTRPVSTWTCTDVEWNSLFTSKSDRIVANCVDPTTCGSGPQYCVAANTGKVLTLATAVRYWSVETTRSTHLGANESALHTVAACLAFRAAVDEGWPNASISWGFSWIALNTMEGEYPAIRALVAGYVQTYGDEFTFMPGGYFAPMYNLQNVTNTDIHDALALITAVVGGGYRPKAIIAGFLGAQTLAYLAEVEDIHVAQSTIFSQLGIDYGDGDGGSPMPFYPSTEHYIKPAQGPTDMIDLVALDGWTVDFMAARRDGFANGFDSRMGVGPIETVGTFGPGVGLAEQMYATAQHFNTGFALNSEAYVTSIWEICLQVDVSYLSSC